MLSINDLSVKYIMFISCLEAILQSDVPCKTVRIKDKDHDFITPLIESLLGERNRLGRTGHAEQADKLATRINHLIFFERSKRLAHMADASAKELCNAVRKSTNTSKRTPNVTKLLADPDAVNQYFAAIVALSIVTPVYCVLNNIC